MRELKISEIIMISGGKSATRLELEKECRDDINMGFGAGLGIGAAASRGHPVVTLASGLVGMSVARLISPECKELAKGDDSKNYNRADRKGRR